MRAIDWHIKFWIWIHKPQLTSLVAEVHWTRVTLLRGFYGVETSTGSSSFGIQPTVDDFTPGDDDFKSSKPNRMDSYCSGFRPISFRLVIAMIEPGKCNWI